MRGCRFGLVTVSYCALLLLTACGEPAAPDPRTDALMVRTAVVQSAVSRSRSFTGTVAARVESDLGFRVSGKVKQRLVDAGQTVNRGQPLMRIEPMDLRLAADAQLEEVAAARARAQQTAEDELRYRDLRGTGAMSASTYDQVKAAADAARAELRAAEAQANLAANALHYSELVADTDGVVMETLVEPGQVVSAGQVVVRIAHAGRREAVVQLPETFRPSIGSIGQATLFGRNSVTIPVKLRQLSDAADWLTRTFEARYVMEGELANTPLGATVTVQVTEGPAGAQNAQMQVPIAALFDAGRGPGVWVIVGESSQVVWRSVTVQSLDDENANVTGNIKAGERIVALGAHLLKEGESVRAAEEVAGGRS